MAAIVNADAESRWFDWDRILARTFVRQIDFHSECVSTSDLALSRDADDLVSPLLVATDRQTAGRGRGSNRWQTTDGALTFSLRLDPAGFRIEREHWPLVSLATAIAVADTLAAIAIGHCVGLKWPNDVHLDGLKICGILVETPADRSGHMVIGIGINVANPIEDESHPLLGQATSLLDRTGRAESPGDVLIALLRNLEQGLISLGQTPATIRQRWQRQCVLTGRHVSLQSGDRQVSGMCRGISDTGAILLETDSEVRPWYGGVVRLVTT